MYTFQFGDFEVAFSRFTFACETNGFAPEALAGILKERNCNWGASERPLTPEEAMAMVSQANDAAWSRHGEGQDGPTEIKAACNEFSWSAGGRTTVTLQKAEGGWALGFAPAYETVIGWREAALRRATRAILMFQPTPGHLLMLAAIAAEAAVDAAREEAKHAFGDSRPVGGERPSMWADEEE